MGEGRCSSQSYTPGNLPPKKETRYPFYRRLCGLQCRSERVRKTSRPTGFELRTIQRIAHRYTDSALPVSYGTLITMKYFRETLEILLNTCLWVAITKMCWNFPGETSALSSIINRSSPVTGPVWPRGFQDVQPRRFSLHSAHDGGEVVSPTHRPPLLPGMFLVLIFTRGWVGPKAMVQSEGICH
jgi:hypothetical protein